MKIRSVALKVTFLCCAMSCSLVLTSEGGSALRELARFYCIRLHFPAELCSVLPSRLCDGPVAYDSSQEEVVVNLVQSWELDGILNVSAPTSEENVCHFDQDGRKQQDTLKYQLKNQKRQRVSRKTQKKRRNRSNKEPRRHHK